MPHTPWHPQHLPEGLTYTGGAKHHCGTVRWDEGRLERQRDRESTLVVWGVSEVGQFDLRMMKDPGKAKGPICVSVFPADHCVSLRG